MVEVPVGVMGVKVGVTVGEGISVFVGVTGVTRITPEVRMIGVAVIMPGVREGIAVQTGKGCGCAFHTSHAASKKDIKSREMIFFMSVSC
jgi:hypothetical protein